MFNIQRPPRWMFDALGIISGGAPLRMWEELQTTVDVIQGGLGDAVYRSGYEATPGLVAPGSTADEVNSVKFGYLFRCSFENLDSATKVFEIFQVDNTKSNAGSFWVASKSINAGNKNTWAEISGGTSYHFIPPGYRLWLIVPAMTTLQAVVTWEMIRVPAGTKPW